MGEQLARGCWQCIPVVLGAGHYTCFRPRALSAYGAMSLRSVSGMRCAVLCPSSRNPLRALQSGFRIPQSRLPLPSPTEDGEDGDESHHHQQHGHLSGLHSHLHMPMHSQQPHGGHHGLLPQLGSQTLGSTPPGLPSIGALAQLPQAAAAALTAAAAVAASKRPLDGGAGGAGVMGSGGGGGGGYMSGGGGGGGGNSSQKRGRRAAKEQKVGGEKKVRASVMLMRGGQGCWKG